MATGRKTGGRGKGTTNKDREYLKEVIEKTMPTAERIQLLVDLSRGVKVLDDAGNVYQTPPDKEALKYLTDQQHGKSPQSMDVTSGGKAIATTIVVPAFDGILPDTDDKPRARKPAKKKNQAV